MVDSLDTSTPSSESPPKASSGNGSAPSILVGHSPFSQQAWRTAEAKAKRMLSTASWKRQSRSRSVMEPTWYLPSTWIRQRTTWHGGVQALKALLRHHRRCLLGSRSVHSSLDVCLRDIRYREHAKCAGALGHRGIPRSLGSRAQLGLPRSPHSRSAPYHPQLFEVRPAVSPVRSHRCPHDRARRLVSERTESPLRQRRYWDTAAKRQ